MKIPILSLVLALVLLAGCKTTEIVREVPVPYEVKRDSIVIRTLRDTVFQYPEQSNQVITRDSSYLKTDLAFSVAKIDSTGMLFHSIQNFGKVPGKVISTDTKTEQDKPKLVETFTTKYETVIEEVPIRDIWSHLGMLGSIAFVVFIVYKVKRFV